MVVWSLVSYMHAFCIFEEHVASGILDYLVNALMMKLDSSGLNLCMIFEFASHAR